MQVRGSSGAVWEVTLATSAWSRLRGMIAAHPRGLLLATRSVHTFWIGAPIWIVGIDASGRVTHSRRLARRRFAWLGRARWILELPLETPPPRPGERLTLWATGGEPDGYGRASLSVCHPDRQPR